MPAEIPSEVLMQEIAYQHLFNQFWLSVFLVIPMVLIARAGSFFVGGQELRRIFSDDKLAPDQSVGYATEQVFLGTGHKQLIVIVRAFFLLPGVDARLDTS